jgi:hypothetical protein
VALVHYFVVFGRIPLTIRRGRHQLKSRHLIQVSQCPTPRLHDVILGDVMVLEPGEVIPRDGLWSQCNNVRCDGSRLYCAVVYLVPLKFTTQPSLEPSWTLRFLSFRFNQSFHSHDPNPNERTRERDCDPRSSKAPTTTMV